ncbi:MAG: hypothetical protein ACPGO3_09550 [Magnetospiraceae bacterium]
MLKRASLFAAAIAVCAALPVRPASACETVHMLNFDITEGAYDIRINGVFVSQDEGASSGGRPIMAHDWLQQGKNDVVITFADGPAKATFDIVTGCRGDFDTSEPLSSASFKKPGTQTLTFTYDDPIAAEFTKAEKAGEDGLMNAVATLQKAMADGDVDTVIALHAPMMREAERQGVPVDRIKGMLGELVGMKQATLPKDLSAEPALDGTIYVVTGPDRSAPVAVEIKEANGSFSWFSGVYWGRFNGEWGVVALYFPG